MTRRADELPLREAIRTRSFTPGRRDAAPLVALLQADPAVAGEVERALLRAPAVAAAAAARALADSHGEPRVALAHLLGRLSALGSQPAFVATCTLVSDGEPRTRRAAIRALGHLSPDDARRDEAAALLLAAWQGEQAIEQRRALAEALGKTGGEAARSALAAADPADPELRRIVAEAQLRLSRQRLEGEGTLDEAARFTRPLPALARCRRGLAPLLADELATLGGRVVTPERVAFSLSGRLDAPLRARTLLGFSLPLPARSGPPVEAAALALASDEAAAILEPLSRGAVRYRLAWADGQRHRADTLTIVRAVAARRPTWVNDPSARHFEIVIHPGVAGTHLEITPRLDDHRFDYRVADVPAASHPTLAAALARVAGARDDDVVWDPFCGSGCELVERARFGAYARLVGSDHDARALAAAQQNLAAAKVERVSLQLGDATALGVDGVTLVITNPPMGRRVERHAGLQERLDRFVLHVARQLVRRPEAPSRFVWLSPFPERTLDVATRAGLTVTLRREVDLGGFNAELQRFEKR